MKFLQCWLLFVSCAVQSISIKSEQITDDALVNGKTILELAYKAQQQCESCDGTPDFNEFCSLIQAVNCVKNKLDILNARLAGLLMQAGSIIAERIAFQTKILCDQIEDMDLRLVAKTVAVIHQLNNIIANTVVGYEAALDLVLQIRILETDVSREQTAQLRDISNTVAQVKQAVCLALLNAQRAITDSLIESQQQVILALEASNEQVTEKSLELFEAIFESMSQINRAILHSSQIIPLQIHEELSAIQVQLAQVTDALLAIIAQIGYGNTDLMEQQVAAVQGSINKYSTLYAQQFAKIAKKEGLQADRLGAQFIAIQDALIAQQGENAQAVVTQAAIDNKVLAEDASKVHQQLTSFVQGVCSKIDNIQVTVGHLICNKEAEIFADLVKAFNYVALCIAEVNEQIETLMIVNTEQAQNSFNIRADAVTLSMDTLESAILAATGELSASLQKVDAQIGQVLRAKISNLETANVRGSNQLSKSIMSLQANIGKQVCQEISDATKDLTLQQETICAKVSQLNADVSSLLLQLSSDFQNNVDNTESTLCSQVSTIQSDLGSQIITEINQALTSITLARNNFAYTINSQENTLADLFINQIQAHNAHMDEQFYGMLTQCFCDLENSLAMQELTMTSKIMAFQENAQENILQTKEELEGAIGDRELAITVILLAIAGLNAAIGKVFSGELEISIACACIPAPI